MSIAPGTRIAPPTRPLEQSLTQGNIPDLERWLTDRVAFHLHRAPDEIDPDTPLADYGIDSVAAISICGEIEEHYRLAVAPTIAYDFPTVHALTGHLADRLADKAKRAEDPS